MGLKDGTTKSEDVLSKINLAIEVLQDKVGREARNACSNTSISYILLARESFSCFARQPCDQNDTCSIYLCLWLSSAIDCT